MFIKSIQRLTNPLNIGFALTSINQNGKKQMHKGFSVIVQKVIEDLGDPNMVMRIMSN